ncbi:hypothetical protein [Listeria booriae]|uniref:Uncharacterized protein n=1 Tax=Listeria booriae TaxID=1552123 RepID=A0A7X0YL34_9LIST|nr:hypothetical protein [Listeria booriae]MBC2116397.1 hypothetical protein [Listeria booriae]
MGRFLSSLLLVCLIGVFLLGFIFDPGLFMLEFVGVILEVLLALLLCALFFYFMELIELNKVKWVYTLNGVLLFITFLLGGVIWGDIEITSNSIIQYFLFIVLLLVTLGLLYVYDRFLQHILLFVLIQVLLICDFLIYLYLGFGWFFGS